MLMLLGIRMLNASRLMNHRSIALVTVLLHQFVTAPAAQITLAGQTFTLPEGFEISLVADTNLALRPVSPIAPPVRR